MVLGYGIIFLLINTQPHVRGQRHGVTKGQKRSPPLWPPSRFHTATGEMQIDIFGGGFG